MMIKRRDVYTIYNIDHEIKKIINKHVWTMHKTNNGEVLYYTLYCLSPETCST